MKSLKTWLQKNNMANHTTEEIIEEITHSHEVVATAQEFTSSRRKVFNKYMVAVAIVALLLLFTYLFLTSAQLMALQDALRKDGHLFYWMLLVGFTAEIVPAYILRSPLPVLPAQLVIGSWGILIKN